MRLTTISRPSLLLLAVLAALLLGACDGSGQSGGLDFDVRREIPKVFAGSGTLQELLDNAFHDLASGDRVRTEPAQGEALLQAQVGGETCQVFLFFDSDLQLSQCSESEVAADASCLLRGAATFDVCRRQLLQTASAEVTVSGTWLTLTYLPEQRITLVAVSDGEVEVWPVTRMEGYQLGEPIRVGREQYMWTAPDDMMAPDMAGIPARTPMSFDSLPPLVDMLGIHGWMERASVVTREHDVPPPLDGGREPYDVSGEELLAAVVRGDAPRVEALLEAGVDPMSRDRDGDTALHVAAELGRPDIALMLLNAGADVNARGRFEFTPLVRAAHHGQPEMIRLLLEAGADINARDEVGWDALMHAANFGHPEAVQLLLELGADPNWLTQAEETRLHILASYAEATPVRLEIVKLLLEYGADVNAQSRAGWTALMYAARRGNVEMVDLLLSYDADPGMRNADGQTAADVARDSGHEEIAEMLAGY